MKVIVKVQMPLFTTEKEPLALVYDAEARIPPTMVPVKDLAGLFGRGEVKKFFYAEVVDGVLKIGGPAPWQEW